MVERQRQANHECRVIPFRHANAASSHIESLIDTTSGRSRTLRQIDVMLLLPIIAPLTAAILLGLLGWFVAWLTIVGLLVSAIVFGDLARALQWRLHGLPVRNLKAPATDGC